MRPETGRALGALSVSGLKKNICHKKPDFAIRGVVRYDPTMTMLAMTILIHFRVVYWVTEPPTLTLRSNLTYYTAA